MPIDTSKSISAVTYNGVNIPLAGGEDCPSRPWELIMTRGEPCPQEMLLSHTFNIKEMFTKTSGGIKLIPTYVWVALTTAGPVIYQIISWSSLFCNEGDKSNTAKISLTGANSGCLSVDGHGNISVFYDEDCTVSATLGELSYEQYCLVDYS